MFPATANMEVFLMQNQDLWNYYNGFWQDVYGFKMMAMKKRTKGEAQVIIRRLVLSTDLQRLFIKNMPHAEENRKFFD